MSENAALAFSKAMFFDPLQLAFFVPGMLLSLWASYRVKSTFKKYSQVPAQSGMSGAEAARELIRARGVPGVRVEPTSGFLSDHYDPSAKVLRLSPDVYHGRSLAALGVAAHEAGHAIQHARDYGPLRFRSLVVKPAGIGSSLGAYISIAGLMFNSIGRVWLGVILFSVFVLFTLVTLHVEFDASRRAVIALKEVGIISAGEAPGAQAVLRAAAMTYVAAAVAAILQLLYFLMRAGILGGRDR
jgi:Zn-dependent membrane protease YugP